MSWNLWLNFPTTSTPSTSVKENNNLTSILTNTESKINHNAALNTKSILLKNPYKNGIKPTFYASIVRSPKQYIFAHKIEKYIVENVMKSCIGVLRRKFMSKNNWVRSIVRIYVNSMGRIGSFIIVWIVWSWNVRNVCRIRCIRVWKNILKLCHFLSYRQLLNRNKLFFWNNRNRRLNQWFSKQRKLWKN